MTTEKENGQIRAVDPDFLNGVNNTILSNQLLPGSTNVYVTKLSDYIGIYSGAEGAIKIVKIGSNPVDITFQWLRIGTTSNGAFSRLTTGGSISTNYSIGYSYYLEGGHGTGAATTIAKDVFFDAVLALNATINGERKRKLYKVTGYTGMDTSSNPLFGSGMSYTVLRLGRDEDNASNANPF